MDASTNHFRKQYEGKRLGLDEALGWIQDNDTVVAAMAAAEPEGFFEGIGKRCHSLRGVTVHCANPSRAYPCFTDENLCGRLTLAVMFLTSPIRKEQGHDRVHYVPQHLSQWVRNLDRRSSISVFWGSCTPPDERGFVSLGPGACYEPEIVRRADKVILEVNPRVPMTSGATHIPISWVDGFVERQRELPTVARPAMDAEDHEIAATVAELVEDGSTIQLGIGAIPNAIGKALEAKRDLGVHTEMINDTMMDLYLGGVITGRKKTIWPGKIAGAFVYGSRQLYDFVDRNPVVELQPASVVNDPYRIARNHKMVSINTAVEIDLTGQVCSESIGHQELSGVGGAWETHVGAQHSEGGRGIIAMRSTTRDGKTSKIAFELRPGAKVSISRNDVDTVVTEYGAAELAGKTVAERVKALCRIAHPTFRETLYEKAKQANYV